MRAPWKIGVICCAVLSIVTGCSTHRGVLDDNSYYSTDSPNLHIKVADRYLYRSGPSGTYRHQYLDRENHRAVYIHYLLHDPNQNRVDYYEYPEHWIYAPIPNTIELERFQEDLVGEKWYGRDIVKHASAASCALIRDLGLFTDSHDLLKMLYVREMPSYSCSQWKQGEALDESQQNYLDDFRRGFEEDLTITKYTESSQ